MKMYKQREPMLAGRAEVKFSLITRWYKWIIQKRGQTLHFLSEVIEWVSEKKTLYRVS